MSRLAILAVTLSALSWSGDSFVNTIITTTNTPSRSYTASEYYQRSIHVGSSSDIIEYHYPLYRRTSPARKAALLSDPPSSSGGGRNKRGRGGRSSNNGGADVNTEGWHRRIFGRIPWRRGQQSKSSLKSSSSSSSPAAPLQMMSGGNTNTIVEDETRSATNMVKSIVADSDFIARNFETMDPESILPVVPQSSIAIGTTKKQQKVEPPLTLDSEYFDVAITPADNTSTNNAKTGRGIPSAPKLICRLLENILTDRIGVRWPAELPEDLTIDVRPSIGKYNNIGRLFRGRFRADAELNCGRIVFDPIRFSSIKLNMDQVTLNLMGFFQNNEVNEQKQKKLKQGDASISQQDDRKGPSNTKNNNVRYPKQFDLHIEDLTMSRHDLLFSPCVKNGLRRLLISILKDRGVQSSSIEITSMDILPTGKISCKGEAKTHFGSAPIRFEVRSGISRSNRGHVLTFPGLEISLNRDIGLFVPVVPTLDLDVGHNTKFHSVIIDGKQKLLKIAASVTITPDRTVRLMQDYVQTSDAFSARFFYDIGRWLTKLGRFSK